MENLEQEVERLVVRLGFREADVQQVTTFLKRPDMEDLLLAVLFTAGDHAAAAISPLLTWAGAVFQGTRDTSERAPALPRAIRRKLLRRARKLSDVEGEALRVLLICDVYARAHNRIEGL